MAVHNPLMPEEESQRIRGEVRRVFLEVWDPIRIKDEPNAQDEYDRYIGKALELLITGGTDKQILEYLDWIIRRMGMDGSRVSLKTVVVALRAINLANKPTVA
jgi:hypothetical protein